MYIDIYFFSISDTSTLQNSFFALEFLRGTVIVVLFSFQSDRLFDEEDEDEEFTAPLDDDVSDLWDAVIATDILIVFEDVYMCLCV